MLTAYNEKKQLITLEDYQKEMQIFCPDCGDRLIYKNGDVRAAHFAHRPLADCTGLSEGESEEHLRLKKRLYEWGKRSSKEWKMEAPLPEIPQRPDLLCRRLAVEVQCTPLKLQRLKTRIEGYRAAKYEDWWLLGTRLAPKKALTSLHKGFCSLDRNRGIHLWLINQREICLLYQMYKDQQGLQYQTQRWRYGEARPEQIFSKVPKKKPQQIQLTLAEIRENKRTLAQKLHWSDERTKVLQSFFYERGEHVSYLADWHYLPSRYRLFFEDEILVFRYLYEKTKGNFVETGKQFFARQPSWLFYRISQRDIYRGLFQETAYLYARRKHFVVR